MFSNFRDLVVLMCVGFQTFFRLPLKCIIRLRTTNDQKIERSKFDKVEYIYFK